MKLCEPLFKKMFHSSTRAIKQLHDAAARSVKYVYTVCIYVLYIYHRADGVYIRGFYFFALVSEMAFLFSYVKIFYII